MKDINKAAALYTKKLKGIVTTPIIPEGYYSSWAQYTIQLKQRATRWAADLSEEQGIPSMIYYPTPMHGQTAYKHLKYSAESNPVTQQLCATVLSLPVTHI